jgi:hypothetical protein
MRIAPSVVLALIAATALSACNVAADTVEKMETIGSNDLKDGKAITAEATDHLDFNRWP